MATKCYYHATRKTNLDSILEDKVIYTGIDGVIYLAESKEDAYKFIGIRVFDEDVAIIEIKGLDKSKIVETFDHNYSFFKCRSYGYTEDIPADLISNIWRVTKN